MSLALVLPALAACKATSGTTSGNSGNGGAGAGQVGGGGTGNVGGGTGGVGNDGGSGGGIGGLNLGGEGGSGGQGGMIVNPCGTGCGDVELCDLEHLGLDDDCDGVVDEDCGCLSGQAHSCFKGDSSYVGSPGCFPGTMTCTESGDWGPCIGGVHAVDGCASADPLGCHPISAVPFVTTNLADGAGNFDDDAASGVYTVSCPSGVSPCPPVQPGDTYQALQSGEYTVTYEKTLGDGTTQSCTFPLFVGARGLRVELSWEFEADVDVDLHLHQPNNTQPWSTSGSNADCGYGNCKASSFGSLPNWFNGVAPPDPVAWWDEGSFDANSCYHAPRGEGAEWASMGMGCHNPRLDIDNISCTLGETDPDSFDFCAPENINVDWPPKDEWFRIGVHYYGSHSSSMNIHPRIKIFCEGQLAAELGARIDPMTGQLIPAGYDDTITWTPADGGSFFSNAYWLAADVKFIDDQCSASTCVVQPLYMNDALKTPYLTTESVTSSSFGPPYPP